MELSSPLELEKEVTIGLEDASNSVEYMVGKVQSDFNSQEDPELRGPYNAAQRGSDNSK